MKKENWVWMPHAGHFILGDKCGFRLATYVGKYIVSTVGELDMGERQIKEIHARIHDLGWYTANKHLMGDAWNAAYFKRFGWENLGYGRKYETMVFRAKRAKDNFCCPWRMVNGELDFAGYNKAEDALKGHMAMCKKWSAK